MAHSSVCWHLAATTTGSEPGGPHSSEREAQLSDPGLRPLQDGGVVVPRVVPGYLCSASGPHPAERHRDLERGPRSGLGADLHRTASCLPDFPAPDKQGLFCASPGDRHRRLRQVPRRRPVADGQDPDWGTTSRRRPVMANQRRPGPDLLAARMELPQSCVLRTSRRRGRGVLNSQASSPDVADELPQTSTDDRVVRDSVPSRHQAYKSSPLAFVLHCRDHALPERPTLTHCGITAINPLTCDVPTHFGRVGAADGDTGEQSVSLTSPLTVVNEYEGVRLVGGHCGSPVTGFPCVTR